MKTILTTALAVLGALVAGLAATWAPALASEQARAGSERPVIVRVEGDKANGFGIHYADGTSIYPPTDSEAYAECGEYDRWGDRLRCRVEVRTWYRDLGDLQRALAHVHGG